MKGLFIISSMMSEGKLIGDKGKSQIVITLRCFLKKYEFSWGAINLAVNATLHK
jgi:hypothetical protein